MANNKNQKVEPMRVSPEESRVPTGRPNIDEINKRNAEEEKQDRKSSYIVTGIMVLLVVAVMVLAYFFI